MLRKFDVTPPRRSCNVAFEVDPSFDFSERVRKHRETYLAHASFYQLAIVVDPEPFVAIALFILSFCDFLRPLRIIPTAVRLRVRYIHVAIWNPSEVRMFWLLRFKCS